MTSLPEGKELAKNESEVLFLPGCKVRQVEFKTASRDNRLVNGVGRRFKSKTISGVDKFQFWIENAINRHRLMFGVDTKAELDQWMEVLTHVTSVDPDTINPEDAATVKWVRIWAVLCRGCFYGFKSDKSDEVPLLVFVLPQCSVQYVQQAERRSKKLLAFKLTQPHCRSLNLSAENHQDLMKWLQALQMEACKVVGEDDTSSIDTDNPSTPRHDDALTQVWGRDKGYLLQLIRNKLLRRKKKAFSSLVEGETIYNKELARSHEGGLLIQQDDQASVDSGQECDIQIFCTSDIR
nr:hypothetical protein BaRGS_005196 [Batillaria attramentaria]